MQSVVFYPAQTALPHPLGSGQQWRRAHAREQDGKSLTSPTSLTGSSASQLADGVDAVPHGQRPNRVDRLTPAVEFPETVLSGIVADGDITRRFQPVWDDPAVLPLTQPVAELEPTFVAGRLDQRVQGDRPWVPAGVEDVGEVRIFGGAIGVYDVVERGSLARGCFRVEPRQVQ